MTMGGQDNNDDAVASDSGVREIVLPRDEGEGVLEIALGGELAPRVPRPDLLLPDLPAPEAAASSLDERASAAPPPSGVRSYRVCPHCGVENLDEGERFCPTCGLLMRPASRELTPQLKHLATTPPRASLKDKPRPCPVCGTPTTGDRCWDCGARLVGVDL